MNILVTGGLGFIGCYVASTLYNMGYSVYIVDNLSRSKDWCVKYAEARGFHVIKRDILDLELDNFPSKINVLIHLAALIDVEESMRIPEKYYSVNALGTLRLYRLCVRGLCDRFIYISSASVYGDSEKIPIDEDQVYNPINPYGSSKASAELGIRSIARYTAKTNYVVLRLFNVYGLGQGLEYAGVITRFVERISKGMPPIIYGDGEQVRDFIHVIDVVRSIIMFIDINDLGGRIYNVASGKGVRIRDLANLVVRLGGLDLKPIHVEPRSGDVRVSVASISRITNDLGWKPTIDLESGLMEMVKYYRDKDSEYLYRILDNIIF